MTFSDIVLAVQNRLNLTSQESRTRIGDEVNDRYKRVTSSLGLNVVRRTPAPVQATTSIGISTLTFIGVEKLYNVIDKSVSPNHVLTEISIEEMRARPQGNSTLREYSILSMGASTVTIQLDINPQTAFPLYADGESNALNLSGTMIPAFAESYHDILMHGALADEYKKLEKFQAARDCEKDYETRLSELRYFIRKSASLEIFQGKTNKSHSTLGTGSGGSGSAAGGTSYTQTGLVTFDRSSAAPNDEPFAVAAGANKVPNLDADKLDGMDSTAFALAAHHTQHELAGIDPIKLDALFTPDDNTNLNATALRHGLLPKLPNDSAKYLNGLGNYVIPPNVLPNPIVQDLLFVDATSDIGKISASRPRDLFLSRNEVVGGTLDVAGVLTSTGGIQVLGGSGFPSGSLTKQAVQGFRLTGITGSTSDFELINNGITGTVVASVPTGTQRFKVAQGVEFPAVQNPSASVNTLDDYVEATWTPVIGGSGGQSGQTYSLQFGRCIKIGKRVFFSGRATLTAKGTITASVVIGGLPFTSSNNNANDYSAGSVPYWAGFTSSVILTGCYVPPNVNYAVLAGVTVAAVGSTNFVTADISNATDLIFSGSYEAAA